MNKHVTVFSASHFESQRDFGLKLFALRSRMAWNVYYCISTFNAMTHNESHVCDVAPSPTRARGHVAERRAAAPRSPSRPAGAAMYIRAVMCRCANSYDASEASTAKIICAFSR